ncbi:phage tail assembly chaperone [Novosphingobium sp.]|uniref:phage tail assembly chaperone n=1 Tax=Novosphingobium sp. TaxID=1874826 RepID=UPI002B490A40|nr:phage tail assembly chaperone [Novosphingobium sp.]HKR92533.1 phage tail assembly chaperone [Novosphingobium sp.]
MMRERGERPRPDAPRRPERFASAALALCSLTARALGWRPQEFWASTPAELAAALGLLAPGADRPGLDRETLQRLMEHDHG